MYRVVRDEAGLAVPDAMAFMAQGMLIDTLMAMRLQDMDDPDARELTACGFGVEMKCLDQLRMLAGEASDFTSRRWRLPTAPPHGASPERARTRLRAAGLAVPATLWSVHSRP